MQRLLFAAVAALCLSSASGFATGAFLPRVSELRASPLAHMSPRLSLRMGAEINAPAPDFSLQSSTGKDYSLKTLQGKWTVLYFYPKAFTQGCTCEAQGFEKDAAEIRKLGAEIVGVSIDTVDKLKEFAEAYSLSFPLLSDPGCKVADAYGSAIKLPFVGAVAANRKTYIIDPKGQLRYTFEKVNSQDPGSEVMAKLKELKA